MIRGSLWFVIAPVGESRALLIWAASSNNFGDKLVIKIFHQLTEIIGLKHLQSPKNPRCCTGDFGALLAAFQAGLPQTQLNKNL